MSSTAGADDYSDNDGEESVSKSRPGVSRQQRISAEGLERLEKQFQSGVKVSLAVQQQWIKRYGQAAADIIRKYTGNS